MSDRSKIEWTDATWNPVTGCTKVSPACTNCYAERFAERFRGVPGHPYEQGFDLKLWPERLTLPLRWKQPRTVFVNSMSDLFHEDVPEDFIGKVFEVMIDANHHIFQILTKRSERMLAWLQSNFTLASNGNGKPAWPPHIWLGVSVENQNYTWRIRHLQKTPALVRYLSIEPLLGPISLNAGLLDGINWVILGGESGPHARPMNPEWVYDVRDQCERYSVPFFFKQWGAYDQYGKRVGKKRAGRIFDGRTYDAVPNSLCHG
ncbi:MAG: phage Gp37/Gp68 family protein [Thermodesulfobacteriota bacterium]|nr:phage Gp37/Gp68 family protein [Thermodesulfobacteriota bacterium]